MIRKAPPMPTPRPIASACLSLMAAPSLLKLCGLGFEDGSQGFRVQVSSHVAQHDEDDKDQGGTSDANLRPIATALLSLMASLSSLKFCGWGSRVAGFMKAPPMAWPRPIASALLSCIYRL